MLRRAAIVASALALSPAPSLAQGTDVAAERCLRLGRGASTSAAAVHARWLPPRPVALTFAGGLALGPGDGLRGAITARTEVSRWSPFHTALQARVFLGDRSYLAIDALVGVDVVARRGTFFRESSGGDAPWDQDPPDDPSRAEAWLLARARGCGLSQGAWRLLGGARLMLPIPDDAATFPSQFAVALGVSRYAESWSDGTRTGVDLALLGLLDPVRLRPGVMGRVAAIWHRLYLGLEAAWVPGPEGYGAASLDVGLRLSL